MFEVLSKMHLFQSCSVLFFSSIRIFYLRKDNHHQKNNPFVYNEKRIIFRFVGKKWQKKCMAKNTWDIERITSQALEKLK